MTVPIVCPQCGAAYSNIKLPAGTAFACGDCTHELHVPGGPKAAAPGTLPVVQPTRPAGAPPVVQPTGGPPPVVRPTAQPPVVNPTGGPPPVVRPSGGPPPVVEPAKSTPPTVQPGVRPPTVQPGGSGAAPAPMIQPTRKPPTGKQPTKARGGQNPARGKRPAAGRSKRPARGAPRQPPQGRQQPAPTAPMPGGAPAAATPAPAARPQGRPGAGPVRRATNRPVTRVIGEQDIGGPPQAKSRTPLILASVFGVICLAVLVIVIASMTGGDADHEARESYMAGYESGARNRIMIAFGLPRETSDTAYRAFKADFEGASREHFQNGATDGAKAAEPKHGGAELQARAFDLVDVREAMNRMLKRNGDLEGAAVWRSATTIKNVMDKWSGTAPSGVIAELKSSYDRLLDKVIEIDPDHGEARAFRGEIKYGDALLKYVEASWLPDGDRTIAKRVHDRLKRIADKRGGWIPKERQGEIDRIVTKYAAEEQKRKAFVEGPFYAKAMAMKEEVAKDLQEALVNAKKNFKELEDMLNSDANKHLPEAVKKALIANWRESMTKGVDDREYEAVLTHAPYVLFVEKNEQWDPHLVAKQVLGPLTSLNEIFLDKYEKKFELENNMEPIPVVYFRTADAYQQYRWGKFKAQPNRAILAHFEHDKGRLVIHDETDKGTIMHEGTHQLFWYHAKVKSDFAEQSYWFQEGVAEWFSGHRRYTVGEDWRYELGLLQAGRIDGAKLLIGRGDIYALEDLIDFTYGDRAKPGTNHGLIYAQGWMLIYFLNYFDLNDDGTVKVDTPDRPVIGRYRGVWEKMLEYVMIGKNGKPHTGKAAFLDAAGVSSVDELTEMGDLFDRYQRWLAHKVKFKQIKDKRLVPWDKYRNRSGRKTGVIEDDKLPGTRERRRLKSKKKDDGKKEDGGK